MAVSSAEAQGTAPATVGGGSECVGSVGVGRGSIGSSVGVTAVEAVVVV